MVITYSELARKDLDEIYESSLMRWGVEQTNKYMDDLESRIEWLLSNPELGLNRDEVKDSYKSYFQGKHTIFFRKTDKGIEIIGISQRTKTSPSLWIHIDQPCADWIP